MGQSISENHRCVIVGAGHSGLVIAQRLMTIGIDALVVDGANCVGAEWRHRPAHMRLFTPRVLSALPGLAMRGHPEGYPLFPEMADYLEGYRAAMGIEVKLGRRVTRLHQHGPRFALDLSNGRTFRAEAVVLANGSNQKPVVPQEMTQALGPGVEQMVARDYRGPRELAGGRIAVVGDGASGRQIALELAEHGRHVTLSGGGARTAVPRRILGRSLFYWLKHFGIATADRDGLVARILRHRNPLPHSALRRRELAAKGVRFVPRCADARPGELQFEGGSIQAFEVVIWCLGYREEASWNTFAPQDDPAWFIRGRGATDVAGLFVLGRQWLTCRASELIFGADSDARRVQAMIKAHLTAAGTASAPEAIGNPRVDASS